MNYLAMFKGDYLAAAELGPKQPTVTITSLKAVQMEDEKTQAMKEKWVVFFRETKRGWVINKTCAILIAGMFGPETQGWLGKRVTLYSTKVKLGGEKVDGIRVLGSPDLPAPVEVTVKLPKKKAQKVRLVPTAVGASIEPPPAPEEQPDAEGVLPDEAPPEPVNAA